MLQIVLFLMLFLLLVIPMGRYLFHVADGRKTFADPLMDKVDNALYNVLRIDRKDMNWKQYAIALLATNAVMVILGYAILRLQGVLFLNPNAIGSMNADLSFNTIISFMTNTNLQHYAGESSLSYFSQMMVITFMMFTSAASGYAVCMAFIRGLVGKKHQMGNYYVDMIRVITRVLLPLSILVTLLLVWQGSPQTLQANATLTTIEGTLQDLPLGPIASLEAIKHLGTNGGGFLGANSSTPFENPTVLTNMIEMLSMMILPGACAIVFGLMYHHRKDETAVMEKQHRRFFGGEGKTIFIAMFVIFFVGLTVCYSAEKAGNPLLSNLGLTQTWGSMEGKEIRFGVEQSALFSTITTSFTTGTVNNMHDTLTPLGGMIPLLNMMLNVVFGGIGVGLMNMVLYAILAVFICGLMIGRTPEYLGKKIEGREMKLTALAIIIHPLLILGFSAIAVATKAGVEAISNPGFHGLSQVLYEYSSSAANNGSGFEGLADNTLFWNMTTGVVMFFGRYVAIIIQLAIAGSLWKKHRVNESIGTLKTSTTTFRVALVMVVLIFAALTFFPALSLGPIAEQLTLGTVIGG